MQSALMTFGVPPLAYTTQQPMRPAEGQRPAVMVLPQPAPKLLVMAVQSPVDPIE